MKKQIVITGLFASLAILNANLARATTVQTATVTATVATIGNRTASFALTLRDVVNTATTRTNISWSGALGGSTWKIADTMAQLDWTVTDALGGIQIYTDNTAPNASPPTNPTFVDPSPGGINEYNAHNLDSNPAGLLLVPPAGTQSSNSLPVAWSIKPIPYTVNGAGTSGIRHADPNDNIAHGQPADNTDSFQWLYMMDKKTPAIDLSGTNADNIGTAWDDPVVDGIAFSNANPLVTMIKNNGIHQFQGPGDFLLDPDHTSFVYLEANFARAAAQETYTTNKLVIEAFVQ